MAEGQPGLHDHAQPAADETQSPVSTSEAPNQHSSREISAGWPGPVSLWPWKRAAPSHPHAFGRCVSDLKEAFQAPVSPAAFTQAELEPVHCVPLTGLSPPLSWRAGVSAGAADAALCSTPSVGRKLSRVLAASTESCTTRGRPPSGLPTTTAFTCPTRTPEEGTNALKRSRQRRDATLDSAPVSEDPSGLGGSVWCCVRFVFTCLSTNRLKSCCSRLSRLNLVFITFISLDTLPHSSTKQKFYKSPCFSLEHVWREADRWAGWVRKCSLDWSLKLSQRNSFIINIRISASHLITLLGRANACRVI